ncbi:Rv2578c family radical SAM protein [Microbacterium limosum]|uniref:Rv2578c family radical SAM protein n=1 Tax=Microbacterium limosum TaxID=3079935 RepID=A0AAU0MI18_9MICO|nr:Rv2578c family radical SAM protein [Microbacterium sp. Y20]WOQ69806.1 Rv2578c family radical SAM protein [Microbacterium sp. Y20]
MRWRGQQIGAVDADALPGLERIDGLVRSVTTPEFAGITFHEVMSRSALNHVPGDSAMPFSWTINPYRGCTHACAYCLSPDTMILMADGFSRSLRAVQVGDEIMGTQVHGSYRRYVRTRVDAKWSTRKRAHRVHLADGTQLVASGDHRFLSDRGWKHVTGATSGAARRPHLTTSNRLMGFGFGGERFFRITEPSISRKLDLSGTAVKTVSDLRIESIDDLGVEMDMIDITTGTGDFIANGVISHNCFARGTHEYLDFDAGRDFDSQIVVKINVADVLRRELASATWQREHVALGTNTDPYQRAEGRYRLMPDIIETLAASGTPLSVLTKGTLIRRDLPLLRQAAENVPVDLSFSIAVFDEALQQSLEPGTPTTTARLEAVRAASDAGFAVTVFLMPVLPHLTDSVAAIDDALARIAAAGARRVIYGALHLRPGVKPWFLQWLEREHPELVSSYRGLYPGQTSYAPKGYRVWLAKRVRPLLRAHRLDGGDEDEQPMRAAAPGPVLATGRRGAGAAPRFADPTLF